MRGLDGTGWKIAQFSVRPPRGRVVRAVWREDPQFVSGPWTQASAAGGTRGLPGVAAVEEQGPARPGQAHDAAPGAHRADARGVPRHAGARRGPPAPGGARGAPNREGWRQGSSSGPPASWPCSSRGCLSGPARAPSSAARCRGRPRVMLIPHGGPRTLTACCSSSRTARPAAETFSASDKQPMPALLSHGGDEASARS